jgi:hypothetical protein
MDPIIITPNVGIGPFKLGMSELEVQETFKRYANFRGTDNPNNPSYLEQLFTNFEYDSNNKVIFIEISNPYDDFDIVCLFDGIDVFRTKADELVKEIDKKTKYARDDEAQMGFSYIFKEIQLSLWRPSVMTDDILNSPEFLLEFSPENQELEKRHFYFTTVAIAAPGYYE